jgi:hypothetical protein|tara:strand:- start:164 stop:295 length:132 start_codon:yes stop_codon:yes gene_type:complete
MQIKDPNDRIREWIGPDGCDRDYKGSDPEWMDEEKEWDEYDDE